MQVLCFSHLRWGFVYQRPQHLLSRFVSLGMVYVWEEPVYRTCTSPVLEVATSVEGVHVITPVLPESDTSEETSIAVQRTLLDQYIAEQGIDNCVAWYYTPMALRFSDHLLPAVTVYDCMDELSAFKGAPPALVEEERRLFERADVVFAGGASLHAAKRTQHKNVHLFPSSVDRAHFATARTPSLEPGDQAAIPHPRIGFYGVLDERLDIELLREVALTHPEWHFVLIGPIVKVREEDLPHGENLHYLGQKSYAELPEYLGHWDIAMLPFARNASTRFISPTKTPEYLAGGKPVVSTPIQDVVNPYADMGLVRIGETAAEFADAIEHLLAGKQDHWLAQVDAFLADISWDRTFEGMWNEIQRCKHLGS